MGEVAVPFDFVMHRTEVALVFTDQVPALIVRECKRKAFAAHEKVRKSKESRNLPGDKKTIMKIHDIQGSQRMPEKVREPAEQQAAEGMSQTRPGAGLVKEDEKFRVTLELRHAVMNFVVGPDAVPKYVELPPDQVMYEVHCRILYITKDRCWARGEDFYV